MPSLSGRLLRITLIATSEIFLGSWGEETDLNKRPTYKVISDKGPELLSSAAKVQKNNREASYEYQFQNNSQQHEKVKRSGNMPHSGLPSQQNSPKRVGISAALADISRRDSDKNGESFEAFLNDQGVAPSLFNQNGGESPALRQSGVSNGGFGQYMQHVQAVSPGLSQGGAVDSRLFNANANMSGIPNEAQSPDLGVQSTVLLTSESERARRNKGYLEGW